MISCVVNATNTILVLIIDCFTFSYTLCMSFTCKINYIIVFISDYDSYFYELKICECIGSTSVIDDYPSDLKYRQVF